MKKLVAVLAVLALGCTDVPVEPETTDVQLDAVEAKGVYIVTLTDDAPPGLAKKLAGDGIRHEFTAALNGFSANMTHGQAQGLVRNPHVKSVQPARFIEPDAPRVEWNLDRVDQRFLPLDRNTYQRLDDGSGVTVYVIDTGIRVEHQEFGGRAEVGWSFNTLEICSGHGTHVAGTVGGETVGLAPGVRLVSVKVFQCGGSPEDVVIAGVDWVTANAVRPAVVNMSLGGDASVETMLNSAVEASIATGITYVVSAGNDNGDACDKTPASADGVITMGATDDTDFSPSFSNTGPCVDLHAPGVSVYSAIHRLHNSGKRYEYSYLTGTSMAAPHGTGAAALYLGQHPNDTPAQVADALVASATPDVIDFAFALPGTPDLLLYVGEPFTAGTTCDKKNPKACK